MFCLVLLLEKLILRMGVIFVQNEPIPQIAPKGTAFFWNMQIIGLVFWDFAKKVVFLCKKVDFWRQLFITKIRHEVPTKIIKNQGKFLRQFATIIDNSRMYFVWVGRMRWAHWQPTTKWFVLNGEWDEWSKSIKQQEPWSSALDVCIV